MGNNVSEYKHSEFRWYFRGEVNPFIKTDKPLWSTYEINDNDTIEQAFLLFSLGKGYYDGKVKIIGYEINFISYCCKPESFLES